MSVVAAQALDPHKIRGLKNSQQYPELKGSRIALGRLNGNNQGPNTEKDV